MHYTYEYKRKCVELYRQGIWPKKPDSVKEEKDFHRTIRRWARLEDYNDPKVLQHKKHNKVWLPEEKLELVSRVIEGESNLSVALKAGINPGMLYQWVRKYKTLGYNGLVAMKRCRPPKGDYMKKSTSPLPLNESEREELIRLRAEIEYIKAENEAIKKLIALRHEKEAARLKAKKQQSSKNSAKKDTN